MKGIELDVSFSDDEAVAYRLRGSTSTDSRVNLDRRYWLIHPIGFG